MIPKLTTLLLAATTASIPAAEPIETDEAPIPIQQSESQLLAGIQRAICYSGFRKGQHPDRGNGAVNPSDDEILEDLRILHDQCGFKLIRVYDSKENSETVLRLIKANDLDMKVLLGAWLDAEIDNPNCPWRTGPISKEKLEANIELNIEEVDQAIRLAKDYPDIITAVAVGNEALVEWNDHMVPVDSIIAHVRRVKKAIKQPVTVADNYDWWVKNGSKLAEELDFISVHIYPQWEQKDIDDALPYSIANIQAVRNALPKSRLVITEAGWATVASEFGPRASEAKQDRHYNELFAWSKKMNITTFFFEAFDEDWKGDPNNPLGAEKHWGLFTVDRKPKMVMELQSPSTTR